MSLGEAAVLMFSPRRTQCCRNHDVVRSSVPVQRIRRYCRRQARSSVVTSTVPRSECLVARRWVVPL